MQDVISSNKDYALAAAVSFGTAAMSDATFLFRSCFDFFIILHKYYLLYYINMPRKSYGYFTSFQGLNLVL